MQHVWEERSCVLRSAKASMAEEERVRELVVRTEAREMGDGLVS